MHLKTLAIIALLTIPTSCEEIIDNSDSGKINYTPNVGEKVSFEEFKNIANNLDTDLSKYSKLKLTGYCERFNITDGYAKQMYDEGINYLQQLNSSNELVTFTKQGQKITTTINNDSSATKNLSVSEFIKLIILLNDTYSSINMESPYKFEYYASGNKLSLYMKSILMENEQYKDTMTNLNYEDYLLTDWIYYNENGLMEYEDYSIKMTYTDNSIYDVATNTLYEWIE